MREVTVYRANENRACFDFETREDIVGTKENPQTVPNTAFVQTKIKNKELILVEEASTKFDVVPTLEEFSELKAGEQKEWLEQLEIEGDMSNEEKRLALFADFLESNKG